MTPARALRDLAWRSLGFALSASLGCGPCSVVAAAAGAGSGATAADVIVAAGGAG